MFIKHSHNDVPRFKRGRKLTTQLPLRGECRHRPPPWKMELSAVSKA